jgi:hypothetical protein
MMTYFLGLVVFSRHMLLLLYLSPTIDHGLGGSLKVALEKCDGIFRA